MNSKIFKIFKNKIQPQQVTSKLSTPAKKVLMGGVVTPNSVPTTERKRKRGTGPSTGYILFTADANPKVRAENPGVQFGEISRLVIIFNLF